MNTIAQSGQATDFSFRYQQTEQYSKSAELTVNKQQSEGQSTLSVSASYSSSVSISGRAERSYTYAPQQAAPVGAVSEPPAKTQAATNILSFIALRLQQDAAEGATPEELQSRLEAGLEGFLKGFGEAYEQLAGAGLLSPEVEEAIGQTKTDVLDGLSELAEEYGLESPVAGAVNDGVDEPEAREQPSEAIQTISTAPPSVVQDPQSTFAAFANNLVKPGEEFAQLLESSTLNYENLAKRDFSFSLKTQDGDTVTINASAMRGDRVGASQVNYASGYENYSSARYESEHFESNSFHITVDGELDEDELGAINDLLNQVGSLSESFFSGNIEEAFEMALEIGFDEDEIAQFSLSLRQEVTTKVETTYARVQEEHKPHTGGLESLKERYLSGEGDTSVNRLMGFVKMLQDVADKAESLGIERKELPTVAERIAEARDSEGRHAGKLHSFMEKMLERLG